MKKLFLISISAMKSVEESTDYIVHSSTASGAISVAWGFHVRATRERRDLASHEEVFFMVKRIAPSSKGKAMELGAKNI